MTFDAHRCPNGHVSYPGHTLCPECGEKQTETIDLSERRGEVVTWTHSTATPPGVREPNTLAIVEFEMGDDYDGPPVRALGQVASREDAHGDAVADGDVDVAIGDRVEPVYADDLREPGAGIREPESQEWDGFRFRPLA